MNRQQAIAMLRDYEPELRAIGVLSASVFGSVARDEAGPESDIDVAVRLGEGFSQGGLDCFWQLEQLQQRLSRLLGCKVDVVPEPVRKERLKAAIDRDRALVFQQSAAPPSGPYRQRASHLLCTQGMELADFEENRLLYDAIGYDTVHEDKLFDIVRNDLPSLYDAAQSALNGFRKNDAR